MEFIVESDRSPTPTSFLSDALAGGIDEHLSHGTRCHPVKVDPVVHARELRGDELKVGFVDEGRRIHRMARTVPSHYPGEPAQLLIDQCKNVSEGILISFAIEIE
jgi:hypothetical protein